MTVNGTAATFTDVNGLITITSPTLAGGEKIVVTEAQTPPAAVVPVPSIVTGTASVALGRTNGGTPGGSQTTTTADVSSASPLLIARAGLYRNGVSMYAVVAGSPLAINVVPGSFTAGTAGSVIPAASGGAGGYVYALASGTLPSGWSFSTSTGVITIPSTAVAGTTAGLSIRVTDALAAAATTATFSIVVGASGATAAVPSNWDMIFFGDSRTENGITATNPGPFSTKLLAGGLASWIGPVSGNRIRVGRNANFGIASGTSGQAALDPRQSAVNTVTTGQWFRGNSTGAPNSGSDNKGYVQAGQHPAGIVALLLGVNDGSASWPSASRTAMTTIINALTQAGKIVLLYNETPKGVDNMGTVQTNYDLGGPGTAGALAWKAYSDWLSGWDYASGSAYANPKVIVVDSWNEFLDTTQPTASRNKAGYLLEGLHPGAYGTRRLAEIGHARLTAVYGATYTGLPSRATLPTTDGLTTYSAAQPFVNTNPVLKMGSAGVIYGSAATTPAAASVPQAWNLRLLGTGMSGLTVALDTSQVDSDGFTILKVTVGGTLTSSTAAVVTATIQLDQLLSGAPLASAISGGQLAYTDKLRSVARVAVAPGGSKVINSVAPLLVVSDTTAAHGMGAYSFEAANTTGNAKLGNAYVDAADGVTRTYLSELLDLSQPELVSAGTNPTSLSGIQVGVQIQMIVPGNTTVNVNETVYISRVGALRVSN